MALNNSGKRISRNPIELNDYWVSKLIQSSRISLSNAHPQTDRAQYHCMNRWIGVCRTLYKKTFSNNFYKKSFMHNRWGFFVIVYHFIPREKLYDYLWGVIDVSQKLSETLYTVIGSLIIYFSQLRQRLMIETTCRAYQYVDYLAFDNLRTNFPPCSDSS